MLDFFSASTRITNPQRAVNECIDIAFGDNSVDCDLVLLHASIGHSLQLLTKHLRVLCPKATILGCSGAGIVGKEGASETMKDVALMAIKGKEFAVSFATEVYGNLNTYRKTVEMAASLKKQNSNINIIYVLAPGINIANDEVIRGIEDVFGSGIQIFGATSSDNMAGIRTFQAINDEVYEHAAFLIGFADPTLEMHTEATHGFLAVGTPFTVTKADKNRINELDGKPAWLAFTEKLGLPVSATLQDTIPIGALAEQLSPADAKVYGNQHLLRVITHIDSDGSIVYPTFVSEGTQLWLTIRDEDLIFADMERMINSITAGKENKIPVAVFQADCLARGRRLFNRIIKEELVLKMQKPFAVTGDAPPWIGIYGFGEFAKLNNRNVYHNYTTALGVMYRNIQS